jgi:hypothetical protein
MKTFIVINKNMSNEQFLELTINDDFINICPNPETIHIDELFNIYKIKNYITELKWLHNNEIEYYKDGEQLTKGTI